jgi:hypothetical protein
MNFEEMLPHYKLKKGIEFKTCDEYGWLDFEKYENNWSFDVLVNAEFRLKSCKKYPALYFCGRYQAYQLTTSEHVFSTDEEAKLNLEPNFRFIRLVTEVPEMIKEENKND